MKIVCPNPECGQRISLSIEDAGTKGQRPGCSGAIYCPPAEDFPEYRRPAPAIAPPPPPPPARPPVRLTRAHLAAAPDPVTVTPRQRMQALPGGSGLLTGIALYHLQIYLPMFAIAIGLAMQKEHLLMLFVIGIGQVFALLPQLVWKEGWSRIGCFLLLLFATFQFASHAYTLYAVREIPQAFQKYPLSLTAISWIGAAGLTAALATLVSFVIGFRAAAEIDQGELS